MAPQRYIALAGGERGYGYSTVVTPPEPQAPTAIFGFNTNEGDGFNQTIEGRQAWWSGRAPCVRRYYPGMLPATFGQTTATCPEKRLSVSFKPDSTFTAASLATGGGNARLLSWLQSIPAGWTVYLTYYHEVNDDIRTGAITAANFKNAYAQFMPVISGASLAANVTVRLCANFMAYNLNDTTGTYWSDSWIPAHGDMNLLTFDIYGNPGQQTSSTGSNTYGKATGASYGSTYPLPSARFQSMFDILDRTGWATTWGILEINSPARSWDTSETARARWLVDSFELCLARPTRPELVLLWEAPSGVNWDQSFGRNGNVSAGVEALRPYIEGSI